jgi:aryl-phospho-beta-D-glucosidase BglC (GH1 family)
MNRSILTTISLWSLLICFSAADCQVTKESQEPVTDLIRFCAERKGFNLLGKFDVSWSNQGYTEKEFSLIHDLGFNFVRLPLDYRTYTGEGNWDEFIEPEVYEIDQAVEWGIKYNVHVCINLHRAPGFCVNAATLPPNQQLNLWTDTVAQDAFIRHWEFFANRYKDISPDKLSFNLVNEPANVTEEVYTSIMRRAISAIHDITPGRIIFVDGLEYGRILIPALKDEPDIAQVIHCYDPFGLTHYKAEWVDGSTLWPLPHWPMLWISNYLYGPWKSEYKSPLVIEGNFPQGTEVIVNVQQVSTESTLQIKAGSSIILSKKFICGPDTGADFSQVVNTQWGYQNISNKNFSAVTAAPVSRLVFENSSGDWMTINSITLKWNDHESSYFLSDNTWGKKQSNYLMEADGSLKASDGSDLLPFETYRNNIAIAKKDSIPLMVQEFGVYNKTPHDVTIAFLTDLVKLFSENQIGWALWNFSGSFGILNSDRSDCAYELFQGYQLDREMLETLTQFNNTSTFTWQDRKSLTLFPSPAKDFICFSSKDFPGRTLIDISDSSGRLLKTFRIVSDGSEMIQLEVSDIRPGIYLLSAINNNSIYTGKIIIQE